MSEVNLQALYQEVLDSVIKEEIKLPSQPDVMIDVRTAVSDSNSTIKSVTEIIIKDPSLTAYLIKAASSPVYRRAVPPKSLVDVVGLLGLSATSSLVCLYTIGNMIELKSKTAKKLFNHTWERLVVKTSVASYIAQQLKYFPVDQVQMAMLLTEIGSLSVLSTMLETSEEPDTETYFQMCRKYSKKLGCNILEKWEVDHQIIDMLRECGDWNKTWGNDLSLLDIANLALYHTVLLTIEDPSLPDIESLAAFNKIPEDKRDCNDANWLSIISDNDEEIQSIISAYK